MLWTGNVCARAADAEPKAAARAFLEAVRRGDCETAWTYFSSDSQTRIERESEGRIRREPYYADSFAPKNLYCKPTYAHRFNSYDPKSVRVLRQSGGTATVSVNRREPAGFLFPGFWSTRTDVHAAELELVEQNGSWKIIAPDPNAPRR